MSVGEYTSTPIHQLCYITRISLYAVSVQQSTHIVPVLYRILLGALSESGVPEFFTHTPVSTLPAQKVPDALRCLVILTSQPGLCWMRLYEDGSPNNSLPPSLSDRVVLMRGLNSHPSTAVRREQGKLNCRDPQHQKHKKEPKLQVQISRDMQVSWSKLYPHNFWHMLSVLIPESLRSMIKLWPPQNHKMFEARRNLWRWSNPTVLLRAMSAGVAF